MGDKMCDLSGSTQGSVETHREHDSEPSGSTKDEAFLDQLSNH
jgi:hypothetical protein